MFTVRITYLDEVDEYGYLYREFEFEEINEARRFYAMKKEEYKDNELVSVSADCQLKKLKQGGGEMTDEDLESLYYVKKGGNK